MQQLFFDGVLKWDLFFFFFFFFICPLKHHHQKSPGWDSASAQTKAAESVGGGAWGKREH